MKLRTLAASVAALSLLAPVTQGADHVDGPAVRADPAADIADVFAWTTPDARNVNLVLTVPAAAFSDAVQYAFRIESSAGFGQEGIETDVICSFDVDQDIECWVGDQDYVTGDASGVTGLTSNSGLVRVFAGERDDPFYFNNSGFNATLDIVRGAAGSLTFDDAGCPVLDAATSNALVTQLATGGNGFIGSILAIVVQVDRGLLARGGDILAVWASTHRV